MPVAWVKWTARVLPLLFACPSWLLAAAADHYSFEVYLDDRPIGTHHVEMQRNDGMLTVTTTANFKYTLLFVTVYTYEHRTIESWRDGCLVVIESVTNDNGDFYFIEGQQYSKGLVITTREGRRIYHHCVRSFAYWNPALLNVGRLLNTQNGEYQRASIENLGTIRQKAGKRVIDTQKYRLQTEEGDITLWYDASGRWLALQSFMENGSRIRYLSKELASTGIDLL